MEPREILVVDDEGEMAEVIVFLLHGQGYRAHHAPNGRVALQELAQAPVDLVVTDFSMPVMNGCQLVEQIRAEEALASLPVLLLSSLPEAVVRDTCPPVEAFIQKPFRARAFLDRVRRLLSPSARSCEAAA